MDWETEGKRIWAEVKANHKKLDACEGPHDFQPREGEKPLRHEDCTKCGGWVCVIYAIWYRKGLEHGKKKGTCSEDKS